MKFDLLKEKARDLSNRNLLKEAPKIQKVKMVFYLKNDIF